MQFIRVFDSHCHSTFNIEQYCTMGIALYLNYKKISKFAPPPPPPPSQGRIACKNSPGKIRLKKFSQRCNLIPNSDYLYYQLQNRPNCRLTYPSQWFEYLHMFKAI